MPQPPPNYCTESWECISLYLKFYQQDVKGRVEKLVDNASKLYGDRETREVTSKWYGDRKTREVTMNAGLDRAFEVKLLSCVVFVFMGRRGELLLYASEHRGGTNREAVGGDEDTTSYTHRCVCLFYGGARTRMQSTGPLPTPSLPELILYNLGVTSKYI